MSVGLLLLLVSRILVGENALMCPISLRYIPSLRAIFSYPQSLGLLGGKPGASTYMIGIQDEEVFYLDPHDVQPVCLEFLISLLICTSVIEFPDAAIVEFHIAANGKRMIKKTDLHKYIVVTRFSQGLWPFHFKGLIFFNY